MKIIRNIFFSFLALCLIAGTGIFVFFQTFDTDQYVVPIAKKASSALGRQLTIGHVGLGFSSRGISVDAGPVTVADDQDFTTQPFIKIDRIRVRLDLMSLILRHEIHITDILLQSPQIHFIRSEDGQINIRSIVQANRSTVDNVVVKRPNEGVLASYPSSGVIASEGKQSFGLKEIPSVRIQDAAISFIDQNQKFPLDIWLTDINASLDDPAQSKPFQLSFDASLYSNVPNVHVSALVNKISQGGESAGDFTAKGEINITGVVIKDFNIIKTVLSHTLGSFGGMEGNIDNLLNGQLKDKLGEQDTVIEKAQAQFSLHDKTVFIDDSLVQTNIFELTAKGSVDQGLNIDMQTMLHLNNDVSSALVNELEGLKFLCDDSKRIAIGASLKGVFPHLKYKPNKDFRKKSKKALMQEGGRILGILF